jgi:hypothetical protein
MVIEDEDRVEHPIQGFVQVRHVLIAELIKTLNMDSRAHTGDRRSQARAARSDDCSAGDGLYRNPADVPVLNLALRRYVPTRDRGGR